MVPLGIRIYGLGAVALGLVGLVWGDFALQWQPVAAGFPGRTALAYLFSAALAIAGVCVNGLNLHTPRGAAADDTAGQRAEVSVGARRAAPSRSAAVDAATKAAVAAGPAVVGAAALTTLYAVVVIFMHGPQIFQHPGAFATWDGAAEQLALFAGGLAAYVRLSGANGRPGSNDLPGGTDRLGGQNRLGAQNRLGGQIRLGRAAVIIMGVCVLMFGLAHFLYLGFTASMVPAWLPGGQKFWAAATGAGHVAAGVAFLSGVKARLAAILLTVMFGAFSVLVHLPLLLADPHNHLGWVMNAINLALTGAAWSIATLLTGHVPIMQGRALNT
jgi:uncharacterized membrane protein YphA (DoxX/SURF4 family)